jgi:hypothetical protein
MADPNAPAKQPGVAEQSSESDRSIPPSSPELMRTVVWILGLALLVLVIFDGIAALQNKSVNDLNTLTSLIAGGFVGFLTPHVASSLKSGGKGGPPQ